MPLRRLARLFMALDFVTLVDESIVDGNDMRCLLALLDELRLLANGIVVNTLRDFALCFRRLPRRNGIFVRCVFELCEEFSSTNR